MLGNIPLILISSANINKKIDINVTSALKMMFYNTKKICVKQITQIFFKLLLIRGCLLIVFFEGMGARGQAMKSPGPGERLHWAGREQGYSFRCQILITLRRMATIFRTETTRKRAKPKAMAGSIVPSSMSGKSASMKSM